MNRFGFFFRSSDLKWFIFEFWFRFVLAFVWASFRIPIVYKCIFMAVNRIHKSQFWFCSFVSFIWPEQIKIFNFFFVFIYIFLFIWTDFVLYYRLNKNLCPHFIWFFFFVWFEIRFSVDGMTNLRAVFLCQFVSIVGHNNQSTKSWWCKICYVHFTRHGQWCFFFYVA